jgi:GntR family transcriptional regulator
MVSKLAIQAPLYAQVEESLTERIVRGILPPGHQLPPEESLIAEFGVSRTTIRMTIQRLVQQGLVEIRRGKGTFVALPKLTQELTELTGFVEDMETNGRVASARVLGKEVVAASDAVARNLDVTPGALVVQILRIRLANGVPLSFDETYLPEQLGRKVMDTDLSVEPIFTLLEQRFKTPLLGAEYQLEATTADIATATALRVAVGSPIFLIERTSFSTGNRPVDYEKLHYRGDQIRFRTRLPRRVPNTKPKG